MQTKITILINNSQDWINKLNEDEPIEDYVAGMLSTVGVSYEVKIKNEMEGAEDWCKECGHRVSDHKSGLCLRCREEKCNICEIPNHDRFQECKDKGCEIL